MGKTTIEWTHRPRPDGTLMPGHTFNGWWGCEPAPPAPDVEELQSPACDNCYAAAFSLRVGHGDCWPDAARGAHDLSGRPGGERRLFGDAHWNEPRLWNAAALFAGDQHAVFCGSMMDIGEGRADLVEHAERIFRLIPQTPGLLWLLLTKRPDRLLEIVPWSGAWPANVWLGVTVESQPYLWRAEVALKADAAVHFISYEPALGDVNFSGVLGSRRGAVRWLIVGSESGGRARVVPIERARSAVEQARAAGAAPFVKQLDGALLQLGRRGNAIKAIESFPVDLRVRDWPELDARELLRERAELAAEQLRAEGAAPWLVGCVARSWTARPGNEKLEATFGHAAKVAATGRRHLLHAQLVQLRRDIDAAELPGGAS